MISAIDSKRTAASSERLLSPAADRCTVGRGKAPHHHMTPSQLEAPAQREPRGKIKLAPGNDDMLAEFRRVHFCLFCT